MLFISKNNIISPGAVVLWLFCLFRRYTPIVPDPTYALTLDHCAALRVSRSGRTLRLPKPLPSSAQGKQLKVKMRMECETRTGDI